MLACSPRILTKAEHDRDVKGAVEEMVEVTKLITPSRCGKYSFAYSKFLVIALQDYQGAWSFFTSSLVDT